MAGGGQFLVCWKIFFLLENLRPKMQNLGLKYSTIGEFRGKIEIFDTDNVLCWKLAAVCQKIGTFCPYYCLIHDDADYCTDYLACRLLAVSPVDQSSRDSVNGL